MQELRKWIENCGGPKANEKMHSSLRLTGGMDIKEAMES